MTQSEPEVVVVGAGPTGLFLAAELARRQVTVTVLDRLTAPDRTIKAGSINVASAELLDRRGLLGAAERVQQRTLAVVRSVTSAGPDVGAGSTTGRAAFPAVGHFAGMFYRPELVNQDDPLLAAHTATAGGVLVPQYDLESILTEHCAELGVQVRRGVEVRGVRETDGGVLVETDAGALVAGWAIAADGGRSVLRKQLGIEFVGTDPQLVGYQAVADFDPAGLRPGWTWTPRGVYTYGPIPGRLLVARFGPQPADRDAPVSVGELQEVARDVTGLDLTIASAHGRITRWSDNARQAVAYRRGRVLLAGDAAHVHSPFSGQGLNLGLGDAANLGWKLAAVVRDGAAPELLDSYERERHPIAAWVLDWTRAQVALMRGDEHTERLRTVVQNEFFGMPEVMTRLVALGAGIAQRYDVSGDGGGSVDHDVAPDALGGLLGDGRLTDGTRLADHAHDGRFVLLDTTADARWARTVPGPVTVVHDVAAARPSLLVRPDGVICWLDTDGARSAVVLAEAVSRWVFSPATGPAPGGCSG